MSSIPAEIVARLAADLVRMAARLTELGAELARMANTLLDFLEAEQHRDRPAVQAPQPDSTWLTTEEAASRRGWKHPGSIRRFADSGELHGHKRSKRGRWTFMSDAVDAWARGAGEAAQIDACGCVRRKPIRH